MDPWSIGYPYYPSITYDIHDMPSVANYFSITGWWPIKGIIYDEGPPNPWADYSSKQWGDVNVQTVSLKLTSENGIIQYQSSQIPQAIVPVANMGFYFFGISPDDITPGAVYTAELTQTSKTCQSGVEVDQNYVYTFQVAFLDPQHEISKWNPDRKLPQFRGQGWH